MYKASVGELLPEDKSWALVEGMEGVWGFSFSPTIVFSFQTLKKILFQNKGILRAQAPRYLLEWSSFAVDYHLGMAHNGKMSTPRFGKFLKQRSADHAVDAKLSIDHIFDKQLLTFTSNPKELIPGPFFLFLWFTCLFVF